jgi:hypothetical protein
MGWPHCCPGRQVVAGLGIFLGILALLTQDGAAQSPYRPNQGTEVRRLGLSRVGENTLLTLVLDRKAEPKISSRTVLGKPQLVVDFPQARAGRLPSRLEGDGFLVEQAVIETAPTGGGVRIILDLFPDQPYAYWRQSRPGTEGHTIFMVGLKADPTARPKLAQMRPPEPAEPDWKRQLAPEPEVLKERELESASPGAPPEPGPEAIREQEPKISTAPGSFPELRRLLPKAETLLQGLERDGWTVSESHNYDRPGQRFSRDFLLDNRKYPELVVKIAYLPANTPNTPNIGVLSLSTENISTETATKYRGLRQWNFAQIKKHFEDIGDFFDDALKPLRVKLREETQALALRYAPVFENFVKGACRDPKIVQVVMGHVREKVNKRFEGVQYTVCENPLVLLNMVDFLYLKVYFVDPY